MRNNIGLELAVALVDRRGVVSFFAWLPWNRGHNRGRLAVGVLGGDVRNKVCLELAVALVDRRGVIRFFRWWGVEVDYQFIGIGLYSRISLLLYTFAIGVFSSDIIVVVTYYRYRLFRIEIHDINNILVRCSYYIRLIAAV